MTQMNAENMNRLNTWMDRVASVSLVKKPDVRVIALMCLDAETAGENSVVWHQSARFYGYRCNCVPCNRAR